MIKVYKISTIIFVLFVLCAPSCEDEQETANREEAILTATKNDIRTEFETDYLTQTSLFAYETTAKQKLSDLADYLHIMTDTSLDMSFRVKASEIMKGTFLSENIALRLILQEGEPVKKLEVHTIIIRGLENKLPHLPFTFDSICIYEPLQRINNSTYSGILRFSQNFTDPAISEQIIKSIRRNTDFYVVKEGKVFGTDSLKIWNVRLGEVR
jgi:hypothetical protein